MVSKTCGICDKFIRTLNPFYCSYCSKWYHTKCLNIESKFSKNLWMCNKCRHDIFPFESSPRHNSCYNLSDLKPLFNQLNSISFLNSDVNSDEATSIDCKYLESADLKSLFSKRKPYFSFFHLNISSLEKHHDELYSFLSDLPHSFDLIGISETRLSSSSLPSISLPGYSFTHTPSTSHAGGVGLYIANHLTFKPRDDLNKILYSSSLLESIFVEVFLNNSANFIIGCIYKHPKFDVNDFNVNISMLLSKVDTEKKNIILLGDFNIDLLSCKTNKSYSNFLDICASSHLFPFITLPTRITSESSTLIDNIFMSSSNYKTTSGNLTISISDHLPQFLMLYSLNLNSNTTSFKPTYYRKWSAFNSTNFRNDFNQISWNEILALENRDCDFSFNAFLSKINSLIDEHVPLIKLSKRQAKLHSKPWITKGILTSMKIRDNFFRDYLNSSSPDIKSFLHSRYKLYRNKIVSLLRLSKQNHFKQFFNSNLDNLGKVWEGVREIISPKNSKSSTKISLQTGNTISSDPKVVSKTFNNVFISIADSVRNNIPFTSHHFSKWLTNPNRDSFFINPVTPNEVLKAISSLNNKKSSGPNSIPFQIFECLSESLSNLLADLFNLSFSTGLFPSKLKEARVIPVFKKNSPTQVENYRPISLLSNLDKILQKLMFLRITNFLEHNNILYNRQFGFRSKHSTTNALITSVEQIYKAIDRGDYSASVLIDLQKAFDTVDHSILISKLNHYGIRGLPLSWFKSFLSQRSQFVSISGVNSSTKYIAHGVPQGSVLGPLLFLIYINDLKKAIPFSTVNLFADDTMLFFSNPSLKSLTKKLNIDLKCLTNWLNSNKIALNSSKTELLLFKPRHKICTYDAKFTINGNRIYPSKSVKYLGIYIDDTLSWETHTNFVCNKLRRANGALSKLRFYLPNNLMLSLYYALFHSHLSYACQVWGQNRKSQISRVLTLQKIALRIISFSNFNAHSSPLFLKYKLLSFPDYVKLLNIILVHQSLANSIPNTVSNILSFQSLTNNARPSRYPNRAKTGMLQLPRTFTQTYGDLSIRYQAVLSWNSMQNFYLTDDLTTLSLSYLKYITKFYFLSSYT